MNDKEAGSAENEAGSAQRRHGEEQQRGAVRRRWPPSVAARGRGGESGECGGRQGGELCGRESGAGRRGGERVTSGVVVVDAAGGGQDRAREQRARQQRGATGWECGLGLG
jgi:hypothetical protein